MRAKFINEYGGMEWSGKDPTKAKVIGRIITKEMDLGDVKFEPQAYNVVEEYDDYYVVDSWYKSGVPQVIHKDMVKEYYPVHIDESFSRREDPMKTMDVGAYRSEVWKDFDEDDLYELKDGTILAIVENDDMRGMAGEPVLRLVAYDAEGRKHYVNNDFLDKHPFHTQDRMDIVKWLDMISDENSNSAMSWAI